MGSSPTSGTSYRSLTYKEKQIMEALSFILGIAFVVVIAIAVVAVYAFVKVSKVEDQAKNIEQTISREIEGVYRHLHEMHKGTYDRIDQVERGLITRTDDLERNVFSQMDSRFDKLENKLTNKN